MAKITIEELSGSLKEYLNGLGLTEAQVQELIDNMQEEVIGNTEELATNDKSSIVAAINELFQNANNGKELIANAIGEPLNSNDTFSAMSNDINGLLSTFKTNMMNNGIVVESNDRFKQLIDKIATMVEEGSGKGIKFAEGIHEPTDYIYNTDYDIETNLDFTPTLVFCVISNYLCTNANQYQNYVISNFTQTDTHSGYSICYIKSVTASKFTLHTYNANKYVQINGRDGNVTLHWYAIGVGEEDTTLRDSLASILTEEGVSVTEEDDMASLIGKVDEEFTKDNNTINSLNTTITLLNNQVNSLTSELAGKVAPAGTAVAGDVLSGKTFINNTGQTITGTMAKMSTHTEVAEYVAWNENSIYLGIPAGAYVNTSSTGYPEVYIEKTRLDSNLVPENIVSGKSICGVTGSASKLNVQTGTVNSTSSEYATFTANFKPDLILLSWSSYKLIYSSFYPDTSTYIYPGYRYESTRSPGIYDNGNGTYRIEAYCNPSNQYTTVSYQLYKW